MYLSLHCHHQNDFCIKMGSDESHFNVWLIVRDKVTRQCAQTTSFLKRKANQAEALLLTSLTPYRWAKPAHWTMRRDVMSLQTTVTDLGKRGHYWVTAPENVFSATWHWSYHTHMCACTYTWMHAHTLAQAHTYAYTHTHTHVHTHTNTHTLCVILYTCANATVTHGES